MWRASEGEEVFTYEGKRYQYGWSEEDGHCYYCLKDDLFYRDYRTREMI